MSPISGIFNEGEYLRCFGRSESGACSPPENFASSSVLAEVVPPGIHVDPIQGYDSFLRIKRQADIIIPLHAAAHIGEEAIG